MTTPVRTDAEAQAARRLAEVERALPPNMDDAAGRFTGTFVRRPVLALVINLLIVVAGIAALLAVEVRELPDVDRPVVTITTDYAGAAPEAIDAEITDLIEGAASRVPGVVAIDSQSRFGRSRVTVEFSEDVDIATAANDLRDSVARVADDLPEDASNPEIVKADADASPVMRLSVLSESLPITELTRIARDLIADRISAIDGVADVQLRGERDEVLYIDVDQAALASRGFDVADIAQLVAGVTGEAPAGTIQSDTQELVIRTDSAMRTAEDFAGLKLDATTRLGDVARVFLGPEVGRSISRADGLPRVGLDILRQAGSNTLDISNAVRAELEALRPLMPEGTRVLVSSDDAIFVQGAIDEVVAAIFLAIVIVIGIILAFLGNLRATLIPAITMPVALVGTFAASGWPAFPSTS
jgi:hydrophobic/amphiphilic exporter-1 (mainly G- bacteria), HAE1 family